MSFDPAANRVALADQIRSVLTSSSQPANVQAHPQGDPALPAVLILPRAGGEDGLYLDYRGTHGPNSLITQHLWVEVRVGGDSPAAELKMDRYLTPGLPECLWDAIEPRDTNGDVDHTIGGAVGNCTAMRGVNPPAWFSDTEGTRTWLAARIPVQILNQRND